MNREQSKEAWTVGNPDFAEQREDLLQSIERDQAEVRVAVHQLTGAARSTLTPSLHIKEFPLTWALGAFLVGAWLGSRRAPAHAREPLNGIPQRRMR